MPLSVEVPYVVDSERVYMQSITHPIMTIEGEKYLAAMLKGDDAVEVEWAYQMFVRLNLKLAASIAFRRPLMGGLTRMDYIQAANEGIEHAVWLFDADLGNKFSTYATFWAKQKIQILTAEQGSSINVGRSVVERHRKYLKNLEQHELKGDEPDHVIAEILSMREESVADQKRLALLLAAASLDAPVKNDAKSAELIDLIPSHESGFADIINADTKSRILDILESRLPAREWEIIRLRYVDLRADGSPHTYEEIGEKIGVSRERIRQVLHDTERSNLIARARRILMNAGIGEESEA